MALLNYPFNPLDRSKLARLIRHFNTLPEDDDIQRLFYLQKINYTLHNFPLKSDVFEWLNEEESVEGSWMALLTSYGINPDASIFLKGIQFANAIAHKAIPTEALQEEKDILKLLREREKLVRSELPFKENQERFVALSCRIQQLAETQNETQKVIEKHTQLLGLVKDKIRLIKGHSKKIEPRYQINPLNKRHINNFNYKFIMNGWEEPLIFRVEDRPYLGDVEQSLHFYEVSSYFGDDVAVFMMEFKAEDGDDIIYKPVILSQYANQGSLRDVAQSLKGKPLGQIIATTKFYFNQLIHFCAQLKEAGVYHPDLKLANFLVHNNKLLVSDRKTLINDPNPRATNILSSPRYAPPEYISCLNEERMDYADIAKDTYFDIEQFMAYQIGVALKEFLVLTQIRKLPEELWETDCDISYYFKKSAKKEVLEPIYRNRQLTNLSLLIRELTDSDEGNRLPIKHIPTLLNFISHPPQNFYQKLESLFPTSADAAQELAEIKKLHRNKDIKNSELQKETNLILNRLYDRTPKIARLNWFGELLAYRCYQTCSQTYFKQCAALIDKALRDSDWKKAPWYRKLLHVFSFGLFHVSHVTKVKQIKIDLDLQGAEFQSHFTSLAFLPTAARNKLGISASLQEFLVVHLNEIKPPKTAHDKVSTTGEETDTDITLQPGSPTLCPESQPGSAADTMSFGTFVKKTDSEPDADEDHAESADNAYPSALTAIIASMAMVEEETNIPDTKAITSHLKKNTDERKGPPRSLRRANSTMSRGQAKIIGPEFFQPPQPIASLSDATKPQNRY